MTSIFYWYKPSSTDFFCNNQRISCNTLKLLWIGCPRNAGGGGNVCCCPYTWILLQIAKSNKPIRTENTAKMEPLLLILKYRYAKLLFMITKHKLSIFLYYYNASLNSIRRIMKLVGNKIAHEHIYWDQASLLAPNESFTYNYNDRHGVRVLA
jgi:hypothetical protein